ncbi:MAG: hypothetical protein QF357_10550 [Dehalococcoidia bacterium]|nr:hypothetical protein [Dehalococcoidia bacterium]
MLSGQGMKKHWLVLAAIAALAAFVIACGTDETSTLPNDGVGAQPPNDTVSTGNTGDRDGDGMVDSGIDIPPADPGKTSPPVDPGYATVEALAPIESVQILVLESYPEQYVVQVISGIPNGCATYSHNEVERNGNIINISVYNTVPAPGELIACTELYGLHDENVNLGSEFDRGVEYTVLVNEHPAAYFTTGSAALPQIDNGPGFVVEPAPIESIKVTSDDDMMGEVTYYVEVAWGLTNGCKESLDPNLVQTGSTDFEIYALAKAPTGDVMCTDDYRVESARIPLGVVGQELTSCALYTINAFREVVEFQAIAPNVRCADPGEATPTPAPPTGGGSSIISDQQALEFSLEGNGAEVEYGGQVKSDELFGRFPTELKVNGQRVLVYEFSPGSSVEEASRSVSGDGTSIKNPDGSIVSVMWIEPPHFYTFGNAIVLYLGNDAEMGELLDKVATMFAGTGFDETAGEPEVEALVKLATIERVTIASTRSIPAQHLISMTLALGGSCESFNASSWELEGREVQIEVTTHGPSTPVPCTLAIIYEDHSINIGSEFEAGVEYTVVVNGEAQGTFMGG